MDVYQPIYDAVRSKIVNGDVGQAVADVIRQSFDVSHLVAEAQATGYEQRRPCVLFRPSISIDGNKWCALYGENLQDGVAGFGDSVEQAMDDFDAAWSRKL